MSEKNRKCKFCGKKSYGFRCRECYLNKTTSPSPSRKRKDKEKYELKKSMRKTIKELAERYGKPEREFLTRQDGRIEWLCPHGIGHTVYFPPGSDSVHGCDGCCHFLKKR